MRILFTLTGLLLAGTLPAQITFQKHGERYTQQFRSGVAVVCTDINGDTYDDLMRLNLATNIKVDLQGQEGSLFQTYSTTIGGGGSWNAIAGDVNNDGWPDLVTSGAFDKVKVLYATPFSGDFQIVALDGDNFFAQGANLVDINNDGFLDIFVCDDNATSDIYMNDSTGGFNVIDTIIDFTTNPPSDNSGNYGSVWNDIDNDGDLDLYIAKCRQGVVEPTDPRRINALFINQGDTAWVEMADSFGIAVGWQSWSPDFADIDNDGDLDLFVTNHDAASQLFENVDGQYFEDVTINSGIFVGGLAIQSCFHDFDNDGLQGPTRSSTATSATISSCRSTIPFRAGTSPRLRWAISTPTGLWMCMRPTMSCSIRRAMPLTTRSGCSNPTTTTGCASTWQVPSATAARWAPGSPCTEPGACRCARCSRARAMASPIR